MATELVIKAWCDPCLGADQHTPGMTVTVPAIGELAAYDVEVCSEHVAPLLEAVQALRDYGRPVGKGVPKVPSRAASGERARPDMAHAPTPCPVCGDVLASLSAARHHIREQHDKSLADVGLAEAKVKCDVCGSAFPNNMGLSAHVRASHAGVKQSA